jgi:uncharacterized membrane protein YoaK (UPF0700 family)
MPSQPDPQSKRIPPQSGDTVEPRLLLTLLVMTFVTGFVDAVSYVGLGHVFTANMTGNVVLLGFAVGGAPQLSVERSLVSLCAFVSGALIGGRIVLLMKRSPRRRWLLVAGSSEAVMLFAAAVIAIGFTTEPPAARLYAVIILTALPMGLRTATVRHLGVADITTTVITTTLSGLASDSVIAGGNNPRFGRRFGSVLAMFTGAALGALLLRISLALPLMIGAAAVFSATALYAITRANTERTPA